MLASPGHSPLQIVVSTPSSSTSTPVQSHGRSKPSPSVSTSSSKTLMLPPPKRPRRSAEVLDEDSYVGAIEKIIERDFFPDIPKLQDRLQWLEAVRTGNPLVIRDAQLQIVQRRREKAEEEAETSRHGLVQTPSDSVSFSASYMDSPNSMVSASPAASLRSGLAKSMDFSGSPHVKSSVDTSLSLDDFLRKYTSEDNVSFSNILEKVNKKRQERYRYLSEEEMVSPQDRIADRDQNSTDGYGTSGQPVSTLEGWSYKAKNLLMYDSAEREYAPLTEAEKEERLKLLTKEVNIKNTRFHVKMFDSRLREDEAMAPLCSPLPGMTPMSAWNLSDPEKLKMKYDLEELRRTPQVMGEKEANRVLGKGGSAGYNYVATPSPAPGVDESPFMTWGEIEGTPLRLEMEDTPVGIGGSGDGPRFMIPAPPSRDARAHSLSRNAARSLREKSRLFNSRTSSSSLSPSCSSPARGSGSPGLKSLSAAAQVFVRKAMAKSSVSVDANLRASYRGTPSPYTSKTTSRFREGSVVSRSGSVPPLSSPSIREDIAPRSSP